MSELQRQIQQLLPELTGKNRRIAEELLALPGNLEDSSLKAVAMRCESDSAQVVRLCKRLGFGGFTPFRNALLAELVNGGHTLDRQLAASTSGFQVRVKLLAGSFDSCVKATIRELSEKSVNAAVSLLDQAKRILVCGFGSSGLVARDLQNKLCRLGYVADCQADAEYARSVCAVLCPEDVLVAISFSGRTPAVVDMAQLARTAGVPVVALTNYPDSPLGKLADWTLETVANEDPLRIGSMSSLVAQLLLSDLLCTGLAGLHPEETQKRIRAIYDKMLR